MKNNEILETTLQALARGGDVSAFYRLISPLLPTCYNRIVAQSKNDQDARKQFLLIVTTVYEEYISQNSKVPFSQWCQEALDEKIGITPEASKKKQERIAEDLPDSLSSEILSDLQKTQSRLKRDKILGRKKGDTFSAWENPFLRHLIIQFFLLCILGGGFFAIITFTDFDLHLSLQRKSQVFFQWPLQPERSLQEVKDAISPKAITSHSSEQVATPEEAAREEQPDTLKKTKPAQKVRIQASSSKRKVTAKPTVKPAVPKPARNPKPVIQKRKVTKSIETQTIPQNKPVETPVPPAPEKRAIAKPEQQKPSAAQTSAPVKKVTPHPPSPNTTQPGNPAPTVREEKTDKGEETSSQKLPPPITDSVKKIEGNAVAPATSPAAAPEENSNSENSVENIPQPADNETNSDTGDTN